MALDATVGGVAANAYIDVVTADTFLTVERAPFSVVWLAVATTTAMKEGALIYATRLFDELMEWDGTKKTTTQALRHPRVGLINRDSENIPDTVIAPSLQLATAEMAHALLTRDRISDPEIVGLGIGEVKVDVLAVKVDSGEVLDIFPDTVLAHLEELGTLIPSAVRGGVRTVPLSRA